MKTPAIAGPMMRAEFMLIWPSTIAFVSNSRPTTSPVSAMRAGTRNENAVACMAEVASSIQYSTKSNDTARAIQMALVRRSAFVRIRIVRFEYRSAATPPIGVATSIGTPNAMKTPPSPVFDPLSSLASQPRAMACDWVATKPKAPMTNSVR